MKSFRLVGIATLLSLCGCAQRIDFSIPDKDAVQLEVYEHGRPVIKCALQEGSGARTSLSDWFASNQSDWQWTPVNYVPRRLVRGSTFSLNVMESTAVFVHNGWSYTKPIVSSDLAFLRCEAGA